MKTYAILGGGGSFGIHTAFYLLDHADPKKVIGIGRNPLRPSRSRSTSKSAGTSAITPITSPTSSTRCWSCSTGRSPRSSSTTPRRAKARCRGRSRGASSRPTRWRSHDCAEELMKRDYLERFIQIGTSELYGSVDFAAKEDDADPADQPLRGVEGGVRHVPDVGPQVPQVPDEHHPAVERLLPGPAAASRDPEDGPVRADRPEAAAAGRRPRREVVHPRARSGARHPPRLREGAARHGLQRRAQRADLDPARSWS